MERGAGFKPATAGELVAFWISHDSISSMTATTRSWLTAEGLAQALGYKPRAVYAWELGERPVLLLWRLCWKPTTEPPWKRWRGVWRRIGGKNAQSADCLSRPLQGGFFVDGAEARFCRLDARESGVFAGYSRARRWRERYHYVKPLTWDKRWRGMHERAVFYHSTTSTLSSNIFIIYGVLGAL